MPKGIYPRTIEHNKAISDGLRKKIYTRWNKGLTKETDMRVKNLGIKGGKTRKGMFLREKSYNWKGGRKKDSHGYILILMPEHHKAHSGYVLEHMIVMEDFLKRKLYKNEEIHHINRNPSDNRIENLKLFSDHSEHMKAHFCKGKPVAISYKNRKHLASPDIFTLAEQRKTFD